MKMDFFSELPEGCGSVILSLLSPRDVCRSSAISKGFKSVADSDAVWDRFLPSDHREIVSRSVSPVPFSSKKQLYFRLADSPILLDGGKLSFALDKASGKKCFMLGARELTITWGSSPQYWKWMSLPQSTFSEVARLLAVCWFDITGKIEARLLSPKITYVAYLVFEMREVNYGFNSLPINASVRFVGEKGDKEEDEITNIIFLKPQQSGPEMSAARGLHPQKRMDNWMEIELGEFFNGRDSGEVEMRLMEVKRGNWKGGIVIEGIELRPKCVS
ncbi:hypothetical protein RHGRI_003788 [Rhododendron griersonianum]|uniref:F-box domain-containing protein n=1 Tax=Rhododendron griersonianum TaxID=479676 RepID=A0AAV6L735_9ERIC|nr:hypothetical protein RHGRI_003788 [Rhododendron griersonianum]